MFLPYDGDMQVSKPDTSEIVFKRDISVNEYSVYSFLFTPLMILKWCWNENQIRNSKRRRGLMSGYCINPYYNLPYNPSAPFVRSGFLVSYRIRSAMKFSQNVLHYIWHPSRVYVIHMKYLSRYFQLTQNRTDKAKWRSSRRLIM